MNTPTAPKWTIMVYLAGDNDLTSFCISVLQQLEAVRYRKDVCVLACFESNTPWPKGSRYLTVNCAHRPVKKVLNWEIHNDLITPNGTNNGVPHFCSANGNGANYFSRPTATEGLRRFIDWSIRKHADSERFMLILFGHGPIVAGQTFLLAENPASFLRLQDLQSVLSDHFGEKHERTLSILAFQNCVMNGIETAYAIKDHADFVIGSQGLVLATGWPYEKMISAVVNDPDAETDVIAQHLLKACARSMLDFAVMDRSSEQSACNLVRMRGANTITMDIKQLVDALVEGLSFKIEDKRRVLSYPAICDAVRLARLEAQTYWGETFVDIYDFCERLIQKCNELVKTHDALLCQFGIDHKSKRNFADTDLLRMTKRIIECCMAVNDEIEKLIPATHTYYIGSELQYSHGLSIFFPWTLPAGPFFTKGVRNNKDFLLETAFDTYREYGFVKHSQWSRFLEAFFRATLRNVRRGNRRFTLKQAPVNLSGGLVQESNESFNTNVLISDLEKSSPDTGRVNDEIRFNIKNYPRRNYLSPLDCQRKISQARSVRPGTKQFRDRKSPPVSSLGWNITGLVAEVIQKR